MKPAVRYERLIVRYLQLYALLHILAIAIFFFFERGWGFFAYFLTFWWHLPWFVIASFFVFLGKKTQLAQVWGLAAICFVMSIAYWIYTGDALMQIGHVTILFPLFCIFRIIRLYRTNIKIQ